MKEGSSIGIAASAAVFSWQFFNSFTNESSSQQHHRWLPGPHSVLHNDMRATAAVAVAKCN
jgi:hypothetical protein